MNAKVLPKYRFHVVRFVHCGSAASNRASPLVDSIIRVDHAGELGADRIYAGQMAVLGNTKVGPVIQHMWDQEKVHKETFEKLIVKYRVRPTVMTPIWNAAGFLLGAGTAMMGEKAAMACTVAVESVIVDHYNDQLRVLMAEPEKNKELLQTIQKFRDEEQEHHDSGLDHGAEQAPFYKGLTEVIKIGCKAAIAISKDLFAKQKINHFGSRAYSTRAEKETETDGGKWYLNVGVCLERKPLILRDMSPFEKKYYEHLQRAEFVKSYKSDHEVRLEEDEKRVKNIKSEAFLSKKEIELLSQKTAEEFEESCGLELQRFVKAPRTTAADENNDVKSLNRKLDSNLILLVSYSPNKWRLPDCRWRDGETLRDTANRLIAETFGTALKVYFIGNAPCGFYKYKYSNPERAKNGGGYSGKKIFFYRAFYKSGDVELIRNSGLDYRWATVPEVKTLVTQEQYYKRIRMFMIDDSTSLQEVITAS